MAILYNSATESFNVPGIIVSLILLGLFIWLLVYLTSPIKNDTCNPPRTHLNTLVTVSGYIFWGVFSLFLVYLLFFKNGGAIRSVIPDSRGALGQYGQIRRSTITSPFKRSPAAGRSRLARPGSVAAASR